jgi:hypothetical protein
MINAVILDARDSKLTRPCRLPNTENDLPGKVPGLQ